MELETILKNKNIIQNVLNGVGLDTERLNLIKKISELKDEKIKLTNQYFTPTKNVGSINSPVEYYLFFDMDNTEIKSLEDFKGYLDRLEIFKLLGKKCIGEVKNMARFERGRLEDNIHSFNLILYGKNLMGENYTQTSGDLWEEKAKDLTSSEISVYFNKSKMH